MDSLTLEQAYYIGELVAAIAVIVSLLYVGRQVKQNTDATQISAAQAFVGMYNTFTANLGASDDLAKIWYKGTTDFESLSKMEMIRFNALVGQWYRIMESAYQQYIRGAVDKDVWTGLSKQILDTSSMSGIQEWRKIRQHWYGPEFFKWIDSILQNNDAVPLYTPPKIG